VKFTVTDQAAPSIASLAPSTLTAGGTGFSTDRHRNQLFAGREGAVGRSSHTDDV
jgi:hypothetical protein